MNKDGFSCVGLSVSFVALLVIAVIAEAWALSTVWNWFVPPLFGLVSLTFFQAAGVATVLRMFTGSKSSTSASSKESKTMGEAFVEGFIVAVASPVITVCIAWVFLQFAF